MRLDRCARLALLCLACALPSVAAAQITPPGLGNAHTAAWQALGIRQRLDDEHRREVMSYVGFGTTSGQHDENPYSRPDIFVLNQEYYDQFHEHWLYSVGLSYRRQNMYETAEHEWELKRFHELRLYSRISNVQQLGSFRMLNTFRPEIRGFVNPDFSANEQPVNFRFRVKTQLAWQLDHTDKHRVSVAAEELASIAKDRSAASGWTDFNYREARFSAFYTLNDPRSPVVLDIGYMHNLIGNTRRKLVPVHYLALDVVWMNPFGKRKSKESIREEQE